MSGAEQPQRQRNQRGEGTRLRRELIEAAMRILDRAPASALSLRMVAREAGIAAPSVYAHFKSAETMMAEIVLECWLQLGAEISEGARHSGGRDAFATLQAQMRAFVRYAMERPSRYQLLFATQVDVDVLRDLPGPIRPVYRPVLESIERMASEGIALPTANLSSVVLLTLSIAHGRIGLAHLAPHREGNSTAGVEAFVAEALEGVFRRA
jgi:AcrR family transcriptional regulator